MPRSTCAVVSVMIVLLGGCGGGDAAEPAADSAGAPAGSESASGNTVLADSEDPLDIPSTELPGVFALTAANFAFKPKLLDTHIVGPTTIVFTNKDDVAHNFTFVEFDVDEDVDANATKVFTFGGDTGGVFEFYCKFHPDQMRGTINT